MAEPIIPAQNPAFDSNQTNSAAPPGGLITDGWGGANPRIPPSNWVNYIWNVWGLWIIWLSAKLALFPGYGADQALTIAVGVITPSKGNFSIETEGGAASDDLTNILTTNLDDGREVTLRAVNSAHDVVVKNAAGGAGQIHTWNGLDFTLDSSGVIMKLKRIGADWFEITRSNFSAQNASFTELTGNALGQSVNATYPLFSGIQGNFTVPSGASRARISVMVSSGIRILQNPASSTLATNIITLLVDAIPQQSGRHQWDADGQSNQDLYTDVMVTLTKVLNLAPGAHVLQVNLTASGGAGASGRTVYSQIAPVAVVEFF